MLHWLLHFLGADNVSGEAYALWSGFVGDVGLIATPVILIAKHNCTWPRCIRVGRVQQPDGHYLCKRHAPNPTPEAAQ